MCKNMSKCTHTKAKTEESIDKLMESRNLDKNNENVGNFEKDC